MHIHTYTSHLLHCNLIFLPSLQTRCLSFMGHSTLSAGMENQTVSQLATACCTEVASSHCIRWMWSIDVENIIWKKEWKNWTYIGWKYYVPSRIETMMSFNEPRGRICQFFLQDSIHSPIPLLNLQNLLLLLKH